MNEYKYVCSVDKGVDYKVSLFRKIVNEILNHPRGWNARGYTFREYTQPHAELLVTSPIIHIELSTDAFISSHGPSFEGMSIANCNSHTIHINYERWMTGAKDDGTNDPVRTEMTLNEYRYYVIQHEVGHILWGCTQNDHKKECIKGVSPIMLQQTNGVGQLCRPNHFPLDIDIPPAKS